MNLLRFPFEFANSIRSDTVGEPKSIVFIVLFRNFGQGRRGEDPLTERQDLAPCHVSENGLFPTIYYSNSFSSK